MCSRPDSGKDRCDISSAARVLLSFGGDVVVTSPPEVRDDLLAVAREVTACYAPVS